ncbi:TPA: GNAT family N-acetyltransferase [Pseudomonas putida]|uniref:GNAT family N-acetyltransferase n=1 Tax=Pseudomonas TaxID=286 RepID=UPI00076216C2|nr:MULTISPECIES: GNAT family protein [Pseudomonas]MDD2149519.1 GNAT family N-acetyltransferase [Pseudomonas putida]HDS1681131.1 GNAT family N-acetyltransferase [Pseudomonas putida]
MPYPTLPRTLSTPRTLLVRPTPAFAQQLQQALIDSYPLHQPFLAWAKPDWTLSEVRDSLQLSAEEFLDPAKEKRYFVLAADSGDVIGCIGLRPGNDEYEVGYWANRASSGQGLMREALTCLLDAVDAPVWLTTDIDNHASQRLAERAGFVPAGSKLTELDPSTPRPLYRRAPTERTHETITAR